KSCQRFTFLRLAAYPAVRGEGEEHDAPRIEASVERAKLDQTAGEKSGSSDKQDRKRHLAGQQKFCQRTPPLRILDRARSFLQSGVNLNPRRANRRRNPEQHRRDDRGKE